MTHTGKKSLCVKINLANKFLKQTHTIRLSKTKFDLGRQLSDLEGKNSKFCFLQFLRMVTKNIYMCVLALSNQDYRRSSGKQVKTAKNIISGLKRATIFMKMRLTPLLGPLWSGLS